MKYLVVIEETPTGFSAYSPDIEGCVVSGSTAQDVETDIREAMRQHIYELKQGNINPPCPRSYSQHITVQV